MLGSIENGDLMRRSTEEDLGLLRGQAPVDTDNWTNRLIKTGLYTIIWCLTPSQKINEITTINSPASTRQSQYTDKWITKYNCEGEAGNEAVEVKKGRVDICERHITKEMVKWDWFGQMGSDGTSKYFSDHCQTNTLGGRNTDMFSYDATSRQ